MQMTPLINCQLLDNIASDEIFLWYEKEMKNDAFLKKQMKPNF